jgi:dTDP-4-dehydrorhamnose reductase
LPENIPSTLSEYTFDAIVNCAAYTAVDAAEDNPGLAKTINTDAVKALAEMCHIKGAALFHISTDYIFDGSSSHPISEDDHANPTGVYGLSKWNGEQAIRAVLSRQCIIRTSWLYGPDGKNFLTTMLALAGKNSTIRVVADQVGTPTYVDHLAQAIHKLLHTYFDAPQSFPWGSYHFSNSGVATWYDFAHSIFKLSHLSVNVEPISSTEYPTRASRPAYSVLSKKKIRDTFGIEPPHWRDALEDCLNTMKNNTTL